MANDDIYDAQDWDPSPYEPNTEPLDLLVLSDGNTGVVMSRDDKGILARVKVGEVLPQENIEAMPKIEDGGFLLFTGVRYTRPPNTPEDGNPVWPWAKKEFVEGQWRAATERDFQRHGLMEMLPASSTLVGMTPARTKRI